MNMRFNNLHIGIFGRMNTGKSSLINMLTDQEISIVSESSGTTTDPVIKTVEIKDIGPVTLIDTAGINDLSDIGILKVNKSREIIKRVDCAILLITENQFDQYEVELINQFEDNETPFIIVHNKNDLKKITEITLTSIRSCTNAIVIDISTYQPGDKEQLTSVLKKIIPESAYNQKGLLEDLVKSKEIVLLIVTIDKGAPEGRLILPQNQTIREAIDRECIVITVKDSELDNFLELGITPSLVITDSQLFKTVVKKLPVSIPLTSFSILFARQKGSFSTYLEGAHQIPKLQNDDNILILESCSHHTSCDDIGRVKIPALLQKHTGKSLNFSVVSGLSPLPNNISNISMVIQCGGCMVTRKQIINRIKPFINAHIPVTNYGMALAFTNGYLDRVTSIFRNTHSND